MQNVEIAIAGERLVARASGALHWPAAGLLAVGDLHLGRGSGQALRGGPFLPPYAEADTLDRLAAEIERTDPRIVLCLGDSFDDAAAAERVAASLAGALAPLAAGRDWLWIAGNHDPRPLRAGSLPGAWQDAFARGPLVFRHIAAEAAPPPGAGEISAHFHPKAQLFSRGARISRRCFLADRRRAILPAFGTFTGGLDACDPAFDPLFGREARALMIGSRVTPVPRARLFERA
ncbi:MAG: ligase-associated DNA damage response endonuclease PdeM [Pseudomonadota bacterium]